MIDWNSILWDAFKMSAPVVIPILIIGLIIAVVLALLKRKA